jgi:hypothetical protein
MNYTIFILIVIAFVGFAILQRKNHESRIAEYVGSMGGELLSIEYKTFFIGPFKIAGEGRMVYRFTYRIGDDTREGWVKFGSLGGPDWRI